MIAVLVSPYYKTKLKGLYNTAVQDAESEAEYAECCAPLLVY